MEALDQLVAARKLRWAGHVARMGHERLPRRFLTSWIRNPRPHGRPQFTYGHSLNKTLEWAGISTDFAVWSELAQDRPAWRALILATAEYPPPPPRVLPDTLAADDRHVAAAMASAAARAEAHMVPQSGRPPYRTYQVRPMAANHRPHHPHPTV